MSEVCNFLLAEYDYDTDVAVQRDEAYKVGVEKGREEGIEMGREEGMLERAYTKAVETAKKLLVMNMPIENIAEVTGLKENEVKRLK